MDARLIKTCASPVGAQGFGNIIGLELIFASLRNESV